MCEAHRKVFVVCDENGVPLSAQPYYTLQEACDRCMRETKECVRLFGGDRKDYEMYFKILNVKTNKYVL